MILILVDGQSTVADLCLKTGNRQLTESALSDLEKGGFVELRVEQDSIWAESKKVAQEIRAAAIDKALQFSASRAKEVSRPPATPAEESISIHSVFNALPPSGFHSSQSPIAPGKRKAVSGEKSYSDFSQAGKKAAAQKSSGRASKAPAPTLLERIKALWPKSAPKENIAVKIKPIRRGPRQSTSWLVMLVYTLLFVCALGFLTISFFPYERYLPEVEAVFSQATGKPVKVGTMRVEVYPIPALLLGDVRLGAGKDEMRVREIRLKPDVASLIEPKIYFQEVLLRGLSVQPDVIAGFPAVFSAMSKPDAKVGLRTLRMENVDATLGKLSLPGMDGEASLSANSQLRSLVLRIPDSSVTLELKPVGQRLDVAFDGYAWRPSQGSPVVVDSFNIKGVIDQGVFSIGTLELHVFDGVIQGSAVLRADKMLMLSGDLVFERISAARFGEALGIGSQFAGEAAGKLTYSTIADSWTAIFSEVTADGEFSMRRGSVMGVDLAEVVRRASSAPVQGGATPFEQLTGRIKLTPSNSQFSDLVLSSGLMQSTGFLEVSKGLDVKGRIELQMRGTVNQTRMPITISGPLKAPMLVLGKGR